MANGSAVFFFNKCENGEMDELVVSRRVGADGRSRATVNGSMASMGELAQIVGPTIDLCGQFEHQQLMKPATHVHMLDAWVGEKVTDVLAAYQAAFADAHEAAAELNRVQNAQETTSAKLDEARFTLRRIDEVLLPGGAIVFNSVSPESKAQFEEGIEAIGRHITGRTHVAIDDFNPIDILRAE